MPITPQQLVAEAKAETWEIDIATAAKHIREGQVVIDVRESAEFETAHIHNAVHIARGVIEFKTADHPALANRSAEIILYCKTGGRSALAAFNLQRLGYTNILSLAGGFDAWQKHHQAIDKDTTDFGN